MAENAEGEFQEKNTLAALGISEDSDLTVGQLRAALGVDKTAWICVGGRSLPEDEDTKVQDLDIECNADTEIFVCPVVDAGRQGVEMLCCPEATLKMKPKPKLGLEKFLTLWILLAVLAGIGVGQIPGVHSVLEHLKVGNTNILTAVGMILMLLPPFAAVRYDELLSAVSRIPKRLAIGSIIINWMIGPMVMWALGIATLSQHVDLLQGVVFIGAARCIAMVMVWTALADGDTFLCVSLVLLNSVITVFAYAPVVTFLGWLSTAVGVSIKSEVGFLTVLGNVAIYLGIPLIIGIIMWCIGHGQDCYYTTFLPRFSPIGLISLLWTVLMMFCEMSKPLLDGSVALTDVLLVIIPLLLYFCLMFSGSWIISKFLLNVGYGETVTFAFTAASNNFELALAACTAIFGTSSHQAIATVIGPLIEIPVMLLMVKISKLMYYDKDDNTQKDDDTQEEDGELEDANES